MKIFIESVDIMFELSYFGLDVEKLKAACNAAGLNWLVDFEGDFYIARNPACEEFIEVRFPDGK